MKPECRETLEEAYLFLDGEILDESRRLSIQIHLEECRPCLERYGLEREVGMLLSRLSGCSPCPTELRSKIRDLLENA